ncbi:MAG: alpha/beta hydrolase [Rhodospirillales bacterium]|nr:alpha/beta hydrolase [Rhodospirillales bacterium]
MPLPPLVTTPLTSGTIAYRIAGTGVPLVLLHGLAGNSRSFIRQFEFFAGDHQVIAWDAPGYGGSDDLAADIDLFTDALHELTAVLGLARFVLLGHSMGGVLAARYAARFPDQLRGLILSCTHVGNGLAKGTALPAGYRNRINDLNTMSPGDYGRARATAMLAADTPAGIFQLAAEISAETRARGLENAARVIMETDNSDGLAALALPTLIIAGAVDPVVPPEKTARLRQLVNQATYAEIAGAGHAPYLEKPEPYNAAVQSFIGGL